MNSMAIRKNYRIGGFLFLGERGIYEDPERYHDFINARWSREEMYACLRGKILLPGTIIINPGSGFYVVVESDNKQRLVSLESIGGKYGSN